MVDERGRFEMFANGHRMFLTAASKRKVKESQLQDAENFNLFVSDGGSEMHVSERDVADALDAAGGNDNDYGEEVAGENRMRRTSAASFARRRRRRQKQAFGSSSSSSSVDAGNQLLSACNSLPEPVDELECSGGRMVTLRLRALRGKSMPDLSEGDVIVGMYTRGGSGGGMAGGTRDTGSSSLLSSESGGGDGDDASSRSSSIASLSSSSSSDEAEGGRGRRDGQREDNQKRLHRRVFRILDIHWGYKSYVNLVVDGSSARRGGGGGRSASDSNCFAVCEMIRGSMRA
jgi:hypothetical protein